jgi:DNA-binding NtrC family response regulator
MQPSQSDICYRILVIDDSPAVHEDFKKILCVKKSSPSRLDAAEAALFDQPASAGPQTGFEVDSAFQGEHGLAKVYHALQEERPYALAFLDVRMPPGWSGIEVAPKLWIADPDLQIVICTAHSDYSWEEMFAKIGTSDRMFALKKPFDRTEVLQLAHNLTRKWEFRQGTRLRQKHLEKTLHTRDLLAQQRSEKLHAEIMDLLKDKKKL